MTGHHLGTVHTTNSETSVAGPACSLLLALHWHGLVHIVHTLLRVVIQTSAIEHHLVCHGYVGGRGSQHRHGVQQVVLGGEDVGHVVRHPGPGQVPGLTAGLRLVALRVVAGRVKLSAQAVEEEAEVNIREASLTVGVHSLHLRAEVENSETVATTDWAEQDYKIFVSVLLPQAFSSSSNTIGET